MHDALYVHAHVRILQALDTPAAAMAMGKERKRFPRHLRQAGILGTTGERHVGTRTKDERGKSHEIDDARTIVVRPP